MVKLSQKDKLFRAIGALQSIRSCVHSLDTAGDSYDVTFHKQYVSHIEDCCNEALELLCK